MKKIRKNSSNINKILHEKITIISSGLITIKLKKYFPTAEEHIEEKIPEKKNRTSISGTSSKISYNNIVKESC